MDQDLIDYAKAYAAIVVLENDRKKTRLLDRFMIVSPYDLACRRSHETTHRLYQLTMPSDLQLQDAETILLVMIGDSLDLSVDGGGHV